MSPATRVETRTQELLCYFVEKLHGDLSKSKLLKLIYLTDLYSHMTMGHPITTFVYRLTENGPYDRAFSATTSQLRDSGKLDEILDADLGKDHFSLRKPVTPSLLSEAEVFLTDKVIERFGKLQFDYQLDEAIYELEPAKSTKQSGALYKPLDLASCNFRLKDEEGIGYEAIVAAKKALEREGSIPAKDFIKGL